MRDGRVSRLGDDPVDQQMWEDERDQRVARDDVRRPRRGPAGTIGDDKALREGGGEVDG